MHHLFCVRALTSITYFRWNKIHKVYRLCGLHVFPVVYELLVISNWPLAGTKKVTLSLSVSNNEIWQRELKPNKRFPAQVHKDLQLEFGCTENSSMSFTFGWWVCAPHPRFVDYNDCDVMELFANAMCADGLCLNKFYRSVNVCATFRKLIIVMKESIKVITLQRRIMCYRYWF